MQGFYFYFLGLCGTLLKMSPSIDKNEVPVSRKTARSRTFGTRKDD